MNKRQIVVGGRTFVNKAILRAFCTAELHRCSPGEEVAEDVGRVLRGILSFHPEADLKLGTGIHRLLRGTHPVFRTPVLLVERTDGSITDISYRSAIERIGRPTNDNGPTPPPSTARRDFLIAARTAVRGQVEAFRRNAQIVADDPQGRVRCAVTETLLPMTECDVDHELPWTFASIIEAFVFERELNIETIAIGGFEDGSTERRFADPQLEGDFAQYHFARATLRFVERSTHRRISAEARRVSAPEHGD
jgi:hypothetical protein